MIPRVSMAVLLASLMAASIGAAKEGDIVGYFEGHAEGWFWYDDPEPDPAVEERGTESPAPPAMPPVPPNDPVAALEALQKDLEHAMAQALMEPTEDNVRAYMVLDQEARARAGNFASTWQRVVWTTPSLDHRLVHPVNDQAVHVFNDAKVELMDDFLRTTAEHYGMFFFFREGCPFCHRFAPVLKAFADTYGFFVTAVSLDGGTLPAFPAPRIDRGMAERLQVETVPAVYLVEPRGGAIYPVAFGYVGHRELAERIYTLVHGRPPNPLLEANAMGGL